jgi:integrase
VPKMRLTQAAVERIAPPKAGRVDYFDSHLPGFGLRVSAKKNRSWFVFYRQLGVQRRYTLGSIERVPKVEDAREAARAILRDVARGDDPAVAKAARRTALASEQGAPVVHTVATLAAEFIERYARPKNRSWRDTDGILKRHVLPRWGERPVADITRRDVHDLLDGLVDAGKKPPASPVVDRGGTKAPRVIGGPMAANHALAAIRRMFGWAVERDIIAKSPVDGVRPPAPAVARDHVLTEDQLSRLYAAAAGDGGAYVRALVLSAQRRTEVATMRWSDLDLDKQVWTLPPELTKNKREHVVPLSPALVGILTSLPKIGTFVFSSTGGKRPLSVSVREHLSLKSRSGSCLTGHICDSMRSTDSRGASSRISQMDYFIIVLSDPIG